MPESRALIRDQELGNTALERHPLIFRTDSVVVVLPTAISSAIRRFVIETVCQAGMSDAFENALAIEYARFFHETPLLGGRFQAPLHFERKASAQLADIALQIDEERLLHFVFFVDGLSAYDDGGLAGVNSDTEEIAADIDRRISAARKHFEEKNGASGGLSLIVGCGWGRSLAVRMSQAATSTWRVETISAPDLATLSWTPDFQPLSLWRLLDARDALEEENVHLQNANGLVNLYAWARSIDHHLIPHVNVPDDMVSNDRPTLIMIPQNSLLDLRRDVASGWDEHFSVDQAGQAVRVRRQSATWHFAEDKNLPLYVSIDDIAAGRLRSVFETSKRGWWCEVQVPEGADSDLTWRLWDALCKWSARAAPVLDQHLGELPEGPILWLTIFDKATPPTAEDPIPTADEIRDLTSVSADLDLKVIRVNLGGRFVAALRSPINIAERTLVGALTRGAFQLAAASLSDADLDAIVTEIVPDEWARNVHMFAAF